MPLRRSTCVYVAEKLPDGKRHFTGGFWVVDSEEELGKAVSRPETSPIEGLSAPCGGKGVTVRDPRGHRVRFIYGRRLRGREQLSPLEKTEPVFNGAVEKPRQGAWCRFKQGASLVHKLGHYGFVVPASKFESTKEWYTLNPETENDEICFFHIDLGAEYTDHHVESEPSSGYIVIV